MSKAVLISINPKWCAMIASGEKTVEVRKSHPNLETPFKCYIYCTKGAPFLNRHNGKLYIEQNDKLGGRGFGLYDRLNGKVIGEFMCDKFAEFPHGLSYNDKKICILLSNSAKMTVKEVNDYANGKTIYGWHISDLKIYDTPKELGEFAGNGSTFAFSDDGKKILLSGMKRPPQSWCYVDD